MDFNEVVNNRRSIRKYKPEPVSKEMVTEILKTAQKAPSWKNSQTGRYYVVMSDEMVKKVKAECLPPFNQKNCCDAPVLIVTAFEKGNAGFDNDGTPTNELGDMWGAYDLGLQNQTLMLKAAEMGLDTLVMGIRDADKLREILSISENHTIAPVLALGYRDINPEMPKRMDIEEIAKFY